MPHCRDAELPCPSSRAWILLRAQSRDRLRQAMHRVRLPIDQGRRGREFQSDANAPESRADSMTIGTIGGIFGRSVRRPSRPTRHDTVVAKLALTLICTIALIEHRRAMSGHADMAHAAELRAAQQPHLLHAGVGPLLLLVITTLSVYKPWGPTPYGRRTVSSPDSPSAHLRPRRSSRPWCARDRARRAVP